MLSHEAQCDGIVAVGHDAVLCLEMLNTHIFPFNIIEAFIEIDCL